VKNCRIHFFSKYFFETAKYAFFKKKKNYENTQNFILSHEESGVVTVVPAVKNVLRAPIFLNLRNF